MTNFNTYITTTIPYVNGRPHIGHALEFVQADALVRQRKQLGEKVFFQTGTDDNAFKNVLSAKENGIGAQEFVDRNAQLFIELCEKLQVRYDSFVRTSSLAHHQGVQLFWQKLNRSDLYRRDYSGLYCSGCEDFYRETDLKDGKCPEHKVPATLIEENNYFFKLSRYQEQLYQFIDSDQLLIEPKVRKNEVLRFIERGLLDISISRGRHRSGGLGVPVPGDEGQVVYVWIDALINYLTGLGFGSLDPAVAEYFPSLWSETVDKFHCIGKNVWKFHAVYWPALLLSAGLPLPNKIFVHGFLTEGGEKISKSLGAKVDPLQLADELGAKAIRYYLLAGVPALSDADFSQERLVDVYNSELANGFGNLFSRLRALTCKAGLQEGELVAFEPSGGTEGGIDKAADFEFQLLARNISRTVQRINREIDKQEPWKKIQAGIDDELKEQLNQWVSDLIEASLQLSVTIPGVELKLEDFTNASAKNILFARL